MNVLKNVYNFSAYVISIKFNSQVEVNFNVNQQKLIDFCKKHDITVTGYCPLRNPTNLTQVENQLKNLKVEDMAK